jgi:hypothetical protein
MGGRGRTIEIESFTELFRGFKGRPDGPPFFTYGAPILVMTFLTGESYFLLPQAGTAKRFIFVLNYCLIPMGSLSLTGHLFPHFV